MRKCVFFLVIGVVAAGSLSAQQDSAFLSVTANRGGVRVFIDSRDVGPSPLVKFSLAPGIHKVCGVTCGDRNWVYSEVCETLEVAAGEERHFLMNLPRPLHLTSHPFGARIVYRDSVIGETPWVLFTHEDAGVVRFDKDGYQGVTMVFDASTEHLHALLPAAETVHGNHIWLYGENNESETLMPVVVSASTAVLTGALAAFWKIRADNLHAQYRQTGSQATLQEMRRLDVASGIALGASQISLAFLTYVLLSR